MKPTTPYRPNKLGTWGVKVCVRWSAEGRERGYLSIRREQKMPIFWLPNTLSRCRRLTKASCTFRRTREEGRISVPGKIGAWHEYILQQNKRLQVEPIVYGEKGSESGAIGPVVGRGWSNMWNSAHQGHSVHIQKCFRYFSPCEKKRVKSWSFRASISSLTLTQRFCSPWMLRKHSTSL